MNGFQRVLLLVVCGGLMALAALAGQTGYGDDYGRDAFRSATFGTAKGPRVQASSVMIDYQAESRVEEP